MGLRHRAGLKLTQRLDNGKYTNDETVELKIPIAIPYSINQNGFERVDGRFEHRGTFYKLVKRKLQNDTIYIVCIIDHEEKNLMTTMTEYGKMTNDLPASSKKTFNFLSKLQKDFNSSFNEQVQHTIGWTMELNHLEKAFPTLPAVISIISPPPEAKV
jgi:hypothetical protein